jgi:adenosyl cobinamide kinase/adenosyl cobinamide phosphate guanylyltransferase
MITLVLGGSRSGKSTVAETLAGRLGLPVTYVATMMPGSDDTDLDERIARHQTRRPADWTTIEPPFELGEVLTSTSGVVLLDSLGPWVALNRGALDSDALVEVLARRSDPTVVVSDEVGLGVHPESEWGRQFRDELGAVNQAIAAVADECLLVIAGRVLPLARP